MTSLNFRPLKKEELNNLREDGYIPIPRSKNGTRKLSSSKKVREKVLLRDNYSCQDCFSKADVVHHIIPVWQDRTKINELTNLKSLCKACHAKVHRWSQ